MYTVATEILKPKKAHICSTCKHNNDIWVIHCSDCCDHESWEEKDEYN